MPFTITIRTVLFSRKRDYGLNWYELYAQDSWRVKSNLTINYGLRWSLFPPPWEVNGYQVSPNVSLGGLFNQNVQAMNAGQGYNTDPVISFKLGGPANNGPGLYHFEKADFAPRFSIAYSPKPHSAFLKRILGEGDKTVIRGGISRVYDRDGMELLSSFDQNGAFGLSTTLQNPCCVDGVAQTARLTNLNVIPTVNAVGTTYFQPAPPGGFPQTPGDLQAIAWGIDDTLKTPYSWTPDFSISRDLSKGFALQVAYVGRISRDQLAQRDLMQPLDIKDPKTGIDYFTAASRFAQLYRENVPTSSITNVLVGPTASYWQDMFQPLKPGGAYNLYCGGGSTQSVVKAIYNIYQCFPYIDLLALGTVDYYGGLTDANLPGVSYYANTGPSSYLNPQYASMYAWSSIGSANYNALQMNLTKRMSQGVQLDFNYTFSKSIDIYSSATRVSPFGISSALPNAFSPNQYRGVSDYDLTHQFNANWIVELPFGKDRKFVSHTGRFVDAWIGGWQLSGLARWTSGFPVSVLNGQYYPTNWTIPGLATAVGTPVTAVNKEPDGVVNMFANPTAALADFAPTFPGQSGSRNVIRGDGYAGIDASLSKRWRMPVEGHSLQFRWETFNVTNLVRFNVQSNPPSINQSSSFGNYTGLLTQPRNMQFALRYEF
jgi:hypothetical protein